MDIKQMKAERIKYKGFDINVRFDTTWKSNSCDVFHSVSDIYNMTASKKYAILEVKCSIDEFLILNISSINELSESLSRYTSADEYGKRYMHPKIVKSLTDRYIKSKKNED